MPAEKMAVPKNEDRGGSRVALGISVLVHVILITALIQATRTDQAARGAVRDVPRNTTVIAMRDSGRISGSGQEPTVHGLSVVCTYVVDTAGVARLESGPKRKASRLGCRKTLAMPATMAWPDKLEARFDLDGQLQEIDGRMIRQDDPLVKVVRGWDLATPRPDRQWPGLPTFTIRTTQQR